VATSRAHGSFVHVCAGPIGALQDFGCADASTDESGVRYDGTITMAADLKFSFSLTRSGNVRLTLPAACLDTAAPMMACDEIASFEKNKAKVAVQSVTCQSAGADGGCSCDAVLVPDPVNETGTYAVKLEIDWALPRVRLDLRIPMTESQDQDRLGQLIFSDLLFCAVEPPELDKARGYVATSSDGLQVDCGEGMGRETFRATLPSIPADYFLLWFFVREWNRFIHICARSVSLSWLEEGTRPRAVRRKALFPGENV
jgi:hypothetical protein